MFRLVRFLLLVFPIFKDVVSRASGALGFLPEVARNPCGACLRFLASLLYSFENNLKKDI